MLHRAFGSPRANLTEGITRDVVPIPRAVKVGLKSPAEFNAASYFFATLKNFRLAT